MIAEAIILAAMGGPGEPGDAAGQATAACSRKMAQLAASHNIKDLTSQTLGAAQQLSDGRRLVRLAVTINYNRKGGIERRHAIISCVVSQGGRVEMIEHPLPR